MPNDLERRAVELVIRHARAVGVEVPQDILDLVEQPGPKNGGAILWDNAHPDDTEQRGCCVPEIENDARYCICWVPVFDVEQAEPKFPASRAAIQIAPRMCPKTDGDAGCAYRKTSPERSGGLEEEALFMLATDGTPFYCHTGMRRPIRWEHPDGRTIPGSPDDWQPPIVRGLPFRTNGEPALLCAGWAARGRLEDALMAKAESAANCA